MNYLAHAYLSFQHPEILVGNLISDFVKGKKKLEYSPGIQKGIALHRSIDAFTDQHEATREGKKIFKPAYGLYSAAFMDVVYDHFLACDENEFTEQSLFEFSQWVYVTAEPFAEQFPGSFAKMFPYMKIQNWLYNYRTRWGTEKSFGGLVRRALYMNESETAFRLFEEHYNSLQYCYNLFFTDVKKMAKNTFDALLHEP
jgi:acyl carrier protein phosphodiesterase